MGHRAVAEGEGVIVGGFDRTRCRALRRTAVALAALLAGLAASPRTAGAQSCDPATGSPPGELFLGPNGEQFYPQNTSCPDQFVAPVCKNGTKLTYLDPEDPTGIRRYACVSSPAGATNLPLVVFLHPSRIRTIDSQFGGQGPVAPSTLLQQYQSTADLGGATPGYVLLMPQGRCLKAPPTSSGDGTRFDVFYKDPTHNLDVRAVRAFIQQLADRTTFDESGNAVALPATLATVDSRRVYLMDWSNGGYMAHMLALYHPEQFAAVASFANGDPFDRGPCPVPLPAVSRRPGMMVVHAECDPLVPCSEVASWMTSLRNAGWASEDTVDVVTDSTKVQILAQCNQLSDAAQRQCPTSAHNTYANPQLPTMFAFLKRFRLP